MKKFLKARKKYGKPSSDELHLSSEVNSISMRRLLEKRVIRYSNPWSCLYPTRSTPTDHPKKRGKYSVYSLR
ncbi:hypothetical protein I352_06386 [Cryptococcus deuterogattii MMRL2647]|nr:hypothetical protein I352_06386 [Cryptococcus deuterogattii MMRL2647]